MFVTIRKERHFTSDVLPKDILKDYQGEYESEIVAVKLDNTLRDLQTPVGNARTLEFVELNSEEGWRIYRRSVQFLLITAVHNLYPEAEVIVRFRANRGLYCEVQVPGETLDDAMVQEIEAAMRRMVANNYPIIKEYKSKEEAIKLFKKAKLYAKVNLITDLDKEKVSIYHCAGYSDYFYGAMMSSTGHLGSFSIKRFEAGVLLRTPDMQSQGVVPMPISQPKLSSILAESKRWAGVLNCNYVTDLNRAIRNGTIGDIVCVSEALQEKRIAEIADYLSKRRRDLRLILIAGPSSSGKTSFAHRLAVQLQVTGLKPLSISLDNYFRDRKDTPLTPMGEYDYECLEALDVKLFNEHMIDLMAGKSVVMPRYNFRTGCREWDGQEPIFLEANQPIIVEGIHGLNERLSASVSRASKFKIYVSALTQLNVDAHNRIPTTDARLLRRLVRDYQFRSFSALHTLKRWPDVREGEEKYIFPYQEEADVMFNSSLIYELAVLQQYAKPMLAEVTPDVPEYAKARRILDFCQYFQSIPDISIVPNNSILREFIGGSVFFEKSL